MTNQIFEQKRFRSVLAVGAGMLLVIVLSLGTDMVLHATGFFPPWGDPVTSGPLAAALAYRTLFAIGGSYLAARLAPRAPMRHAMAPGWIGLGLSSLGAAVTWNGGPAFGPHWYPLALIATTLPCAWLGGRMYERVSGAGPSR